MDIQIEATNFNASQDLTKHMKDMFESISKYNDQIVNLTVFLESGNEEIDNKTIKVRVDLPGHEIFVEDHSTDFVTAAQHVYDRLKVQLRDQKEKDKDNFQPRPDKPY